MIRRAVPALVAGAMAAFLAGCASAPVTAPAGRSDDPSYGLMPENRHPANTPLASMPDWQRAFPVENVEGSSAAFSRGFWGVWVGRGLGLDVRLLSGLVAYTVDKQRRQSQADNARLPAEAKADDPVAASGKQHYSWRWESPMAERPKRGRFFLSGFVAGFMARLAYGTYRGAGAQGVSGSDVASSVIIGSLAGFAVWGFSFRLSPGQMTVTTPEHELPRLEDSSVFRDWTTIRR